MLYGPFTAYLYFMLKFLSYIHNILKTCLSIVTSFCFYVVFFCFCIYLFDLFYILLLPLQTYGSMKCMHVRITITTTLTFEILDPLLEIAAFCPLNQFFVTSLHTG